MYTLFFSYYRSALKTYLEEIQCIKDMKLHVSVELFGSEQNLMFKKVYPSLSENTDGGLWVVMILTEHEITGSVMVGHVYRTSFLQEFAYQIGNNYGKSDFYEWFEHRGMLFEQYYMLVTY
jgi:hypothetical protein